MTVLHRSLRDLFRFSLPCKIIVYRSDKKEKTRKWPAKLMAEKYHIRLNSSLWIVCYLFSRFSVPYPFSLHLENFEVTDCSWKRKRIAVKREREKKREKRGKNKIEKAEANGVTWPKDAKLPKRSTRKAWSAPITGPLLVAIMIIAYLERERSCARACPFSTCVWA